MHWGSGFSMFFLFLFCFLFFFGFSICFSLVFWSGFRFLSVFLSSCAEPTVDHGGSGRPFSCKFDPYDDWKQIIVRCR